LFAQVQEEYSFRPTINARSREIASRLRPSDMASFEILHQTADLVGQRQRRGGVGGRCGRGAGYHE
jgi:hypothetical protein